MEKRKRRLFVYFISFSIRIDHGQLLCQKPIFVKSTIDNTLYRKITSKTTTENNKTVDKYELSFDLS